MPAAQWLGATAASGQHADVSCCPFQVLDAMDGYYRLDNSNVHRGVHALSARATTAYEEARDKARTVRWRRPAAGATLSSCLTSFSAVPVLFYIVMMVQ